MNTGNTFCRSYKDLLLLKFSLILPPQIRIMRSKIPIAIIVFCICSFIFSSCEKEWGKTEITGTVQDNAGKPVQGATVFLYEDDLNFDFDIGEIIETTETDAAGKYTFKFDAGRKNSYQVKAAKDRYSEGGNTNVEKGDENILNITIIPEAYLKLRIKNVNPYDQYDRISISAVFNYSPNIFIGSSVDTFMLGEVYGNQYKEIIWWVTKNNIKIEYKDSVYCLPFDTAIYNINY